MKKLLFAVSLVLVAAVPPLLKMLDDANEAERKDIEAALRRIDAAALRARKVKEPAPARDCMVPLRVPRLRGCCFIPQFPALIPATWILSARHSPS